MKRHLYLLEALLFMVFDTWLMLYHPVMDIFFCGFCLLTKQPCYILKLQLRQVSYSLSIKKQLRDALNTVEFDIPVNKQYYEQVNVGDDLVDGFRVGSLIMRGSFGKWRVKIESKHIEIR